MKAGLEEDFVFVPIDETHETIYCYACAPESAMRQSWPVDEGEASIETESNSKEVR
jgi:hypothetical protein